MTRAPTHEGDRARFRALLDERVFEHAPVLSPSPAEAELANQTLDRAAADLPAPIREKLQSRRADAGHPIRPLRYYPFPVVRTEDAEGFHRQALDWGATYASIAEKIVRAFRRPHSNVRRLVHASLVRFLPEHLTPLLDAYRTTDDLAGAHLGDDHIAGRSIEWNVGAVGGLDEGYLVSREVAGNVPPPGQIEEALQPVEADPVPPVREAIHWAYESHCRANGRPPETSPLIAFLEHDDLYGSTVSLCSRMRRAGERTLLAFEQELRWRDGRLVRADREPIDIAYCDCHLEDLEPAHPLLQACARNAVALDSSPLARLILRSKVILALLRMPRFRRDLDLTSEERDALETRLTPTLLWCRKTFSAPPHAFGPGLSAFCARAPLPPPALPPEPPPATAEPLVVKVGIGSVYGGQAVAVASPHPGSPETRFANALLLDHLRPLALSRTPMKARTALGRTRPEIKSFLKDAVLRLLGRGLGEDPPGDPCWTEVRRRCLDALQTPRDAPLTGADLYGALRDPIRAHFGLELSAHRFKPVDRVLQKLLHQRPVGAADQPLLQELCRQLGLALARLRFQAPGFARGYRGFQEELRSSIGEGQDWTCEALLRHLVGKTDAFLTSQFNTTLPQTARDKLRSILLPPYLEHRFRSVNPVVFQPYIQPEPLGGEEDLHVMNRIHVLYTRKGPVTRLAGTQVFYLRDGKADNRSKMTASLWGRSTS